MLYWSRGCDEEYGCRSGSGDDELGAHPEIVIRGEPVLGRELIAGIAQHLIEGKVGSRDRPLLVHGSGEESRDSCMKLAF